MSFVTYGSAKDFIEGASALSSADCTILAGDHLVRLVSPSRNTLAALELNLSREARDWILGEAFESELSSLRVSRAIARRISEVMPEPTQEELGGYSQVQSIHRLAFVGPADLLAASAMARAVLFRVEIPIFRHGERYAVPMVHEPGHERPIYPAAWLRVIDAAMAALHAKLSEGFGLPVRIGEEK